MKLFGEFLPTNPLLSFPAPMHHGMQHHFFSIERVHHFRKVPIFAAPNLFVAQLVEQLTLNQWVPGSNPGEETPNDT
jgi:hypothetical protein